MQESHMENALRGGIYMMKILRGGIYVESPMLREQSNHTWIDLEF